MLLWGYIARHFRRWQIYNRTLAELSQLDDRGLSDLAISRSDIRRIARSTAYGV